MKESNIGPDFITLDGGEGGTGAAPLSFADHVSLPFKIGFKRVYTIFKALDLNNEIPFKFEIIDISPNPFNPNTTISFSIDLYTNITIDIFSIDGILVDKILNEYLYPEIHHIEWIPNNLSNGMYLISINNGRENIVQKVTLLK